MSIHVILPIGNGHILNGNMILLIKTWNQVLLTVAQLPAGAIIAPNSLTVCAPPPPVRLSVLMQIPILQVADRIQITQQQIIILIQQQ